MLSTTRNTISHFNESTRATASILRSQRSARIDMIALVLAATAAVLVRFNLVPGIGW